MIAGLAIEAIGFASFAPFPQPWIFLPLLLASLGLGVFCVSSLAYLGDSVPDALKAAVSGRYYLSWGLGYLLGLLAVGWLDGLLRPQAGYLLLAALMAAQAAVLWVSLISRSRTG